MMNNLAFIILIYLTPITKKNWNVHIKLLLKNQILHQVATFDSFIKKIKNCILIFQPC